MKILFDHCTPRPLRRFLTSHNVTTADQHGWSTLRNGDLLNAAERNGIDIFITTDQKQCGYPEHAGRNEHALERKKRCERSEESTRPSCEITHRHSKT